MNIKNTITEHYRKFFDLHGKGIALDEDDHLNIDWAEDLVKNCFIYAVVGRSEQLICPECENPYPHISKQGTLSCEDCGYNRAN